MDGNSIYMLYMAVVRRETRGKIKQNKTKQSKAKQSKAKQNRPACKTYQAFVWGQQHCDASVNLADRQGDEHG